MPHLCALNMHYARVMRHFMQFWGKDAPCKERWDMKIAKNPEIRMNRERLMFVRSGLTLAVDFNVYQPGFEVLEPGASEIILTFHPSAKNPQHVFTLQELKLLMAFIEAAKEASVGHTKVAKAWEGRAKALAASTNALARESGALEAGASVVVWTEDEEWGEGL